MIQTIYPPHWEVQPYLDGWACILYENNEVSTCYPFQTSEWAMLCKQSMERHDQFLNDRRWGASMGTLVWTQQGQLTSSYHFTMTQWQLEANKPIVVWDQNRQIVKFDIPALVWIWLKTTWVPKAYKRLMWGEKGKQ
jgi:hypothetical protein